MLIPRIPGLWPALGMGLKLNVLSAFPTSMCRPRDPRLSASNHEECILLRTFGAGYVAFRSSEVFCCWHASAGAAHGRVHEECKRDQGEGDMTGWAGQLGENYNYT